MDQHTQPSTIELSPAPNDSSEPSGWRDFLSTVGILITALIVAFLMITYVFRSYQVDGPSMQQTLQNGDKLIIWKVPRTIARITNSSYIPQRGEIIVFTEKDLGQNSDEDNKQLIKRVIGIPGDRVVVGNGTITVFNAENPDGFQPDVTLGYAYPDFPETSNDTEVTLQEDQLFVAGDNRPDSLDSRAFGPIDTEQVIGKLVLRIFPIDQAKFY